MMANAVAVVLLIVGIVHLIPVKGLLGTAHLYSLYGVTIEEPGLAILMRHRAVLFGLLGAFLVYSAFTREFQVVAIVIGLASTLSFVVLAYATGSYGAAIARVVWVDIVASVLLIVAAVLVAYMRS